MGIFHRISGRMGSRFVKNYMLLVQLIKETLFECWDLLSLGR